MNGLNVIVSDALPYVPTFEEDIRRGVRHGMAEAVPWLRIEVGMKPGEATHAIQAHDTLYVSAEMWSRVQKEWSR